MEIKIEKTNSETVVHVSGRVDTANAAAFDQSVSPLFDGDVDRLVFECSDMSYISSSGLRVILNAHKQMTARKGSFVLRHLVDEVQNVMKMTGFSRIITIE